MEIYYDCISRNVPKILENDWEISFKDSREKEIAIKIFEWKYGPQNIYSDMVIESWQDESKVKFNKGYFEGKISFSLNPEKVSIFKIMIAIISFMVADKGEIETYIGGVASLADIFEDALNVHKIKDGIQRCVYLRMIELSKNSPSVEIPLSDILYSYHDFERHCTWKSSFECAGYHEQVCIVKDDNIKEAISKLLDIEVIRIKNGSDDIYYIN